MLRTSLPIACLVLASTLISAQTQVRVRVTLENLAPAQGNYFTPAWVGFHDGTFDLYDSGAPVFGPMAPLGNDALERLAEDGATGFVSTEFAAQGQLIDATIPGPKGPIFPGQSASHSFLLDPLAPTSRYLSFASMVLPSNDAFVANGDPLSMPVFDAAGNFVYATEYRVGTQFLDAGTEVNDELPMNTAALGQMTPNTGVDENGVVSTHSGFLPVGSGGVLDRPRFSQATFRDQGYPGLKLRIERAPAITELRSHVAVLSGANQVPAATTNARGAALFFLTDGGSVVRYFLIFDQLANVTGINLRAGSAGANGPIAVNLLEPALGDSVEMPWAPGGGTIVSYSGTFDANALSGPFAAKPLEHLIGQFAAGAIYVDVTTDDGMAQTMNTMSDYGMGELRGQVFRY